MFLEKVAKMLPEKAPEKLFSAFVFTSVLAVFLVFPTKNYYWDGIDFSYLVEQAAAAAPDVTLLHPNHLLYNVFGWLFFRLLNLFPFPVRSIEALQILNSLSSVLGAFVLFRILRSLEISFYKGICLTLLFSFSATWWKFSTDADTYILSVLFLIISFYLILPSRSSTRPVMVALTHTLAMFFHELAVLFYPTVVLGLYRQTAQFATKKRFGLCFSTAPSPPL